MFEKYFSNWSYTHFLNFFLYIIKCQNETHHYIQSAYLNKNVKNNLYVYCNSQILQLNQMNMHFNNNKNIANFTFLDNFEFQEKNVLS